MQRLLFVSLGTLLLTATAGCNCCGWLCRGCWGSAAPAPAPVVYPSTSYYTEPGCAPGAEIQPYPQAPLLPGPAG